MTPAPGHRDNGKWQGTSERQKKVQKQRPKHGVRLRLIERETRGADHGDRDRQPKSAEQTEVYQAATANILQKQRSILS